MNVNAQSRNDALHMNKTTTTKLKVNEDKEEMVVFRNTNERKLHVLPHNCLKNSLSIFSFFFLWLSGIITGVF